MPPRWPWALTPWPAPCSASAARGLQVQIVRNGSRGLLWLETLVEVETPEGRMAYGPVTADAVPGLIDAGMLQGGSHALCHGLTEAIAYLARQERLTFARVGVIDPLNLADYAAHGGWQGLERAARMEPAAIVQEVLIRACAAVAVRRSRPASSGRPGPPQRGRKSTLPATPTRVTRAPLPTGC